MSKFVYHYHAQYQRDAQTLVHSDGIIETDNLIDTMDRYVEIKEQLAIQQFKNEGIEGVYGHQIILSSLSRLT